MAAIVTTLHCDLQETVKVQYLDGVVFSQDNQANIINVVVTDGGEPATISGSVSANIIRSDGATVAATGGTITDNVCSITLPSAAYLVPGVLSIAVKLTASSVVTTIAAVVANVYQSSTDTAVDPGTIIPDIQALITEMETVRATIPASYTDLWTKLAPAFSSSASYVAGQYFTYNEGLYRVTTSHSGSWSSGDVVAVNIGGELSDVKSAITPIQSDLYDLDGYIEPRQWVRGQRYISNGAEKIVASANIWAMMAEKTYVTLKAGAIVKTSSATSWQFLGGYSTDGGLTWNVISSRASAYTAPADGIYFFSVRRLPAETTMSDAELANLNETFLFDISNKIDEKLTEYAKLASPDFTGTPTAPDVQITDNTTKISNTKHVAEMAQSIAYDGNDLYYYGKDNYPKFEINADNSIDVTIPTSNMRAKRVAAASNSTSFGSTFTYSGNATFNVPHNYMLVFDLSGSPLTGAISVVSGSTIANNSGRIVLLYNSGGTVNGLWRHFYLRQLIEENSAAISQNGVEIKKENLNARHIPYNAASPATAVPALTILHFSDLHADTAALARIKTKAGLAGEIDDMICTGDMVSNTAGQISSWWDEDIMTCIGNHETASYSADTGYDWTALSMADRDAYYIAPFEDNWGITHTSGTSYYYKDYDDQKVRLIVMDGMLYLNPGAEATAQTSWLEGLLASAITSGLHVLIAIHSPHNGAKSVNCSFSKYGAPLTMGLDVSCNTPQDVIDTVATKITAGLHFIGYICGHTHQDNIWDAEDDGKQLMYTITCAAVTQVAQWRNSDQHRDTDADAFNLVTIDTNRTLIKIVRGGGADIDDHMRTRKAICFNYSTGEKVGEVL